MMVYFISLVYNLKLFMKLFYFLILLKILILIDCFYLYVKVLSVNSEDKVMCVYV